MLGVVVLVLQRTLIQVDEAVEEENVAHADNMKVAPVVDAYTEFGMAHEGSIEIQMMSNPMLSIAAASQSQSLEQGGDQPTAQQRREDGGDSISLPGDRASARDCSARDSARRSTSEDFVPPPIDEI